MEEPPQPRTARGRRTRQALLDAAEIEFGERGFVAASIVDITRRAEVGQGTFYIYFPHKEAIFSELVRALSERLRGELSEAIAGAHSRAEIERVGLVTFLSFVSRHRNLYRIVRQAEFVDEALYRWYYQRMADGYTRGLERAQEAGELHTRDPKVIAWALMGIADFIGMRWVLWAEGEPVPESVVDTVMEMLRSGIFSGQTQGV